MISLTSWAQLPSIERYVLASAGGYGETSQNLNFTYTVGEAAVTTISDSNGVYTLTQGFNQPGESPLLPPLRFDWDNTLVQCPDVLDGTITVTPDPDGCPGPYSIEFQANGSVERVENIVGSHTFRDLDSGTYVILVRGFTLCSDVDTVRLELKNNTCDSRFYSGITPNGDGKNDYWEIDNIEISQPNEVMIFDRWGNVVWEASNYNNRDIVWRGENQGGAPLPTGTYFFTISIDGGRSPGEKSGWVQVIR